MATKKSTENEVKDINVSLNLKTIQIPIRGIAPLIVSRFDEKSKQQIEESAPGKLKQGSKKKVTSPEEQYEKSIYYLSDGSVPASLRWHSKPLWFVRLKRYTACR